VCGHPLKAYEGGDGARLLACTGGKACTWVIAKGLIPLPVINKMISDRQEQPQSERTGVVEEGSGR
jgi:hypothetical protein